LVPNRVDRRTLEGLQLMDELTAFGEYVSPAICDRAVFVRAFSSGFAVPKWAGAVAYGEICSLTDLVERFLTSAPAEAQ
jgi:chromosome partitioning protein